MDILEKDEFLKAYRTISAQLKKKFVRKPNVTDAVDGFGKNIPFWYMSDPLNLLASRQSWSTAT